MTTVPLSREMHAVSVPPAASLGPPSVKGKFFAAGGEKLFLRAVSYGPFASQSQRHQFPDRQAVERDFGLIHELGANAIRTFTVPPRWLLDRAHAHGLWVLVGIPWAQHVCFLDSEALVDEIRATVREAIRSTAGHRALFCYIIGNEIPPDIVRWYGPRRIQRFIRRLRDDVKTIAPTALVTYANFPPTEYLDLECVDFVCFNVYLHDREDFRRYLLRLQNIAAHRPLMVSEHGIDSTRLGEDVQAEILSWQLRAAFAAGVAGTCVFSWTDDWFTGGHQIENWTFGLVTRDRMRKPAFDAVRAQFGGPLPPGLKRYPRVSVIVCAYNAARTMEACLTSLENLRYPNWEVIVVNDGSTDRTREIAERHPRFRLINQPNRGLSVARNVGMEAASGEIIAYTDSDCVVDPDWLTYLAYKFVEDGCVAVGGPNLPPPEENALAAYVGAAPGGPTHVLLNDEVAEHIPGCNMAFTKQAIQEVGGFEPIFATAGDDVDLCWRLQNHGYAIGFSPAAMVWHFRRNTVREYLKQQRGYGRAEALLYLRHPYRFNMLGQLRWLGRVYGGVTSSVFSRRPLIYSGAFGRGLFQTIYEPPSSLFAHLPFTLEWNAVAAVMLVAALVAGSYVALALVPLAVTLGSSVVIALRARIDPRYDNLRGRALVAFLVCLGPMLRSYERYRWRIKGLSNVDRVRFAKPTQKPRVRWLAREFFLSYWSETGHEKEDLLESVIKFLMPRKYLIAYDSGWSSWDLEIRGGVWCKSRLWVATENHGGAKRLLNVRCAVKPSRTANIALGWWAALIAVGVYSGVGDLLMAAAMLGVLTTLSVGCQSLRLGRVMYRVLELVAQRINLAPVKLSV